MLRCLYICPKTSGELILDSSLERDGHTQQQKWQSIWWAAMPTSCITTLSTNRASASCVSMVTGLPQCLGGGDGEGGKTEQRWMGEEEEEEGEGEEESIPSLISQ